MVTIDPELQSLIPPLSSDEKIGLESDIKKHGCKDSLVLWNDTIIDGHNRYEICTRNNLPFKTVDFSQKLKTRDDVIDWMYSNQLSRRNLTDESRTYLIGKQYEFNVQRHGGNRGNQYTVLPSAQNEHLPDSTPLTDEQRTYLVGKQREARKTADRIATEQHSTSSTVRRAAEYSRAVDTITKNVGLDTLKNKILQGGIKSNKKDIVELSKKSPEVQRAIIHSVETTPKIELKVVMQEKAKEIRREELAALSEEAKKLPDGIVVHHGDFLKDYDKIPKGFVDCIITDPPYVNEWLSNYEDFAIAAEYVLKPGGFLVAYIGHIHLDKILAQMTPYLDYYWIMCLEHAGHTAAVHSRGVQCSMKPILVFQKLPKTMPKRYFGDVIKGSGREKDAHEWQQGEEELVQIFEPFTDPGDVVLDPFMGSGTTLAMAKKLNRRAIGFDIDETNVAIVRGRLM